MSFKVGDLVVLSDSIALDQVVFLLRAYQWFVAEYYDFFVVAIWPFLFGFVSQLWLVIHEST